MVFKCYIHIKYEFTIFIYICFDVYGKCIDYIAYMNPMGIAWPWFNEWINLTSLSRAQPRIKPLEPGITEIRWSTESKKTGTRWTRTSDTGRDMGAPTPGVTGVLSPRCLEFWRPTLWYIQPRRLLRVCWNPGSHPFRTSREFFEIIDGILYIESYRLKAKTKMTMENKPLKKMYFLLEIFENGDFPVSC